MFKPKAWILDGLKMVGVLLVSTLVAQLFAFFNFQEATLVIIFMLAVLIITQITSHYVYGILSSLLSVLIFNFFFTEPLFSFNTHQPDYIFTFFILFVASMISSTLTSRLKQANQMAASKTRQLELISDIHLAFGMQDLELALLKTQQMLSSYFEVPVTIELHPMDQPLELNAYELSANKTRLGELKFQKASGFESDDEVFIHTIVHSLSQNIERQQLIKKQVESELEIREQKLKNNLLGAISHDLRTPLATIIGSTETILQGQDLLSPDDKNLLLQNILDDARWLIDSVQNILAFIQVDEHIKLRLTQESVEELFGDAVSRVIGYAKQKIQLDLPKENIFFKMDARLMEKVLLNLLHNAMKYAPDDSVISMRAFVKGDALVFEVADQGKGIDDRLKPKVFDRFMTAQDDKIQKRKGLGLGLAICKAIVEAHHGRITVRDNEPHGTIFRCSFPLKENHD